jgi:hypothetical protein
MNSLRPLISLFIIFILLSLVLYFLPQITDFQVSFYQSAILLTGSFFISIIVVLIFQRGYRLGGRSWLLHTLTAISLKFILYLFLIFAVYFFLKNRTLEFILTFFVIYLSFTSYILFSFIKLLKTKNIEK